MFRLWREFFQGKCPVSDVELCTANTSDLNGIRGVPFIKATPTECEVPFRRVIGRADVSRSQITFAEGNVLNLNFLCKGKCRTVFDYQTIAITGLFQQNGQLRL